MATLTVSGVRADLQEGQWQVGDRCLAPHPREKRLCEGTVQRLAATGQGDPAAVVRFAWHDDRDEEQIEDTVAFSKLQKPVPSLDEKPLFHNHQSLPGASVPYELSGDGESIPYTINRYLRDYQREGAKFIYDSYARGTGCILGDDMGLGKTVQVIAFLAATLHKTGTWQDVENNVPHFLLSQKSSEKQKSNKVFLIVAPLSVLYNWKDELDTWGYFRSIIVHGTRKEEEFARVRRGRCEVALTTYETLRLCLDQFNSIDWSAVIVDEAHKIKNPNSQITQAMKGMSCKVRVGLTGTILQNNLEELWCVMDWAIPGCLGTLGHFKNQFADPIELGHKHSGTKRNLATGRQAVKVLARRLSRWFLRRTKALISSQLPKKDDRVVYCSMTPFQETVYRTVLDSEDVNLILRSGQRCSCSSGRPRRKCCFKNNSKGVPVRCLYFSYLTILRKVSNHVALLQPQGSTTKKQEEYVNDICGKVFQKFPDFMQRCKQASFEAMSDPIYSGKMKVLQRLLKHFLQHKDKVLLFSLSTKLLDILESYCMAEGVEYRRLDGNTKSRDRVKIVKEFNSSQDINVCLVSTMAGGLGLNFVGANVVVLFDPTWNPANDLQAVDRVYRIGQCRDVTVFRLISVGSVEEVIYLRQVYKQQLQSSVVGNEHARRYFEAVQGTDNHKGELFGIRNLFRLQTEGTCLTRQILEREGRVEAGVLTASTRTHAGDNETREGTPEERSGREPAGSGVLDFSSASEDDDGEERGGGRMKRRVSGGQDELRPGGAPPAGRSLLHHGFSRLLQAGRADPAGGSGSEGRSGESSDKGAGNGKGEGGTAPRPPPTDPEATGGRGPPSPRQKQDWTISSDSGGEAAGRDQAKRDIAGEMPRSLSEESDDIDGGHQAGHGKRRARRTKRDHGGVAAQRAEYNTDESGDIEVQNPVRPKRTTYAPEPTNGTKGASGRIQVSGRNGKKSPNIESFTSSEDDLPAKKLRASRDRITGSVHPVPAGDRGDTVQVKFTSVKKRSLKKPSSNEKGPPVEDVTVGTIERLLDGVQEVAYMHSNQRVVGSSKAEDRISRAALRDVFERRKYSQLPANQILYSTELLTGHAQQFTPPSEQNMKRGCTEGVGYGQRLEHPVTHTLRATRHSRNATVIMGETPSAIRRKQLEDMASFFKATSVRDFAEDILRMTSVSRLVQLREFYCSQNPELGEILHKMLPEPVEPQPGPANPEPQTSSSSPSSRRRKPASKRSPPMTRSDLHVEIQSPGPSEPTEVKGRAGRKRLGFTSHRPRSPKDWAELDDIIGPEPDVAPGRSDRTECTAPLESTADRRGPQGWAAGGETRMGGDAPKSTPISRVLSEEGRTPKSDPLTDLIGDTSILDDLFKPRTRGVDARGPSPASASVHVERVRRSSSKDFWDILNEGDEESINKLTDLSRVERMCRSSGVEEKAKNHNASASSQLWKRNEKFLWKK
ncbi:hypothetical protein MATL_G00064260 [Megalops atlanticus]|uniref:DNA excision repair protein ERCC-6-like 2 n=1 Tax=Megalops atlanticus TaxID=7932 RepID=A0A9D3QD54_MEGAT|nr:hypothetical protein MATL_G00064260 [Megalops atlanticus]